MDMKVYQQEVKRTCPHLGSDFDDQMHMVIGASTEAGELLDPYKKAFAYGKKLDTVNIKEEIGDVIWYLANLASMLGLDMEDVLQTNVDKLRIRYPEKFTEHNALNRRLEEERIRLEQS